MPPTTRRSAGSSRGGKQQSTLSFNHRVTKPSAAASKTASAKDLVASPSSTAPAKSSPLRKHVATADEEVQTKAKVDVEPEEEKEEEDAVVEKQEEEGEKEEEEQKSEAELRARELGDRHIDRYWRALERERTTRRVHQEGLDVGEKVLRYWDVSSQYGPCVGITRMRRWQRAEKLGLNPPLEVLAVLLREEDKGTNAKAGAGRAHVDEILNPSTVAGVS